MRNNYPMPHSGASIGVVACRASVFNTIGLLAALAVLTLGKPAMSQEVVGPGESIKFDVATDGAEACRRGDVTFTCGVEFLGETAARPNVREVETSARAFLPGSGGHLGVPLYSEASISNDFFIPGPPDNIVDVHFTVAYDFYGNMSSVGLYTLANSLSLRIQDRTNNTFVASHELVAMQRQGDQGIELGIGAAQERASLPGQVAHFTTKLRRGGLYRLHFELQSSAVSFLVGNLRADAFAKWHFLTVSVDEDEVEQIAIHDQDIKAKLQDFEDDLEQIKEDIAEVKEMLQTPQGLRPGFPNVPSKGNSPGSLRRPFGMN